MLLMLQTCCTGTEGPRHPQQQCLPSTRLADTRTPDTTPTSRHQVSHDIIYQSEHTGQPVIRQGLIITEYEV